MQRAMQQHNTTKLNVNNEVEFIHFKSKQCQNYSKVKIGFDNFIGAPGVSNGFWVRMGVSLRH